MSQKSKNPKKMLRKSPASNAWDVKNWVNFRFFSYLKFFSVSIINKTTFIVSVN